MSENKRVQHKREGVKEEKNRPLGSKIRIKRLGT